MAKFGDKVFDFKEVLKYFRTPVSHSGDKSFLNVGKNSVVKVLDYKPLHTWTLMHPHQFTTPVVYSGGKIYCVMDNNVLMRWSPDEDLTNAEKILFQESVFAVNSTDEELFVLFNSGSYAVVDTSSFLDFKFFNFVFLNENEELIWMDTNKTSKAIEVFCLAYNQKSQKNAVYFFTVSKEDKSTSNLSIKCLTHEEATLKSWCLSCGDSSFLSLWSDGTIFSHNLRESKDSQLMSFNNVEVNTIVAIDSIDLTHIVIAKSSLKQKECALEIWDSKCGVPKAKKILKTPSLVSIQILAINSVIFLSCNDELIAFSFYIENPTFSAAVGRSQTKSNQIFEYSWDDDKVELLKIPSGNETNAMEVDDSQDSIELIAEKLLNENSDYMKCIRESELAKLLQLALRHKKEENGRVNSNQVLEEESCILLNNILSASFNDVLLMKYLKMLNSEEVLIALKLLLSYLNQTIKIPSNVIKRPSDLQVVNWTTLIIQTHMEDLLFSKDKTSQKLLKQLKRALSAKMEEYEDFECIQNYFSVIEKKNILPQKCYTGKYTIENLDI